MRVAGLVVLALAFAGAAPAAPRAPAPTVGLPFEPPPAWVEGAGGHSWLAFGTYCWGLCADFRAPRCGGGGAPLVTARRGARVRFHLGFEPVAVTVVTARAPSRSLLPSRRPVWHATRAGIVVLAADGRRGGATYAACLKLI